ncbi:MAG: J domain-containing protein [Flavobacteriales bacterium]|nr:J domain-containing protein [Flavobacteriales bacterium]
MQKEKYYKLLGLTPSASDQEVKKVFRKLAMRYHPDRNPDPQAHELFILLTEAYDVILDKNYNTRSSKTKKAEKTTEEREKENIERMQTARKRYQEQARKEQLENDRFFHSMTTGRKWRNFRLIAIAGAIISILLTADLLLPHHYQEDEVTQYKLNMAFSPSQKVLGVIKTRRDETYWISRMNYFIYSKNRSIYVESSWFFHNPISIIAKNKITPKKFDIHFTSYTISGILIGVFLIPILTLWYRRKKISFTFFYYLSYYGVSVVILLFLITGNRWAHLLTFGLY